MKRSRYTPGTWCVKSEPWPWGFYPATRYEIVTEEVRGSDDDEYEFHTSIASINNAVTDKGTASTFGEYPEPKEAEANAWLIASAPDLLSVMLDMFENPQFQVAIGGNPIMVDALMGRARAAIATALGEERA